MNYLTIFRHLPILLLAAFCCVGQAAADEEQTSAEKLDEAGLLGRRIDDFQLKDIRGKVYSLADYENQPAVVVYFLGTECPLARLYGPRVQKLADEFAGRDVMFLGVSSNTQDSIAELSAHARVHELTFPILKDLGSKVADLFGATRTPQVFVLDAQRTIRYYGRVDAQFTFGSGVGLAQPRAQRRDLAIALEQLLAGKPLNVPVTDAKGCLIGRGRKPKEDSPVTYSKQIARILQKHCLECHRPGQIAPFAMTDYEEVAGWGEMIAEVVREQRMPPWHANPEHGRFANAKILTDKEKQQIHTWVANGCPQGDPADRPAPRQFRDGWFLPRKPDRVVFMTEQPVDVKPEGVEPYRYFEVDPGFEEDTWVRLSECMPGNRAVVHHIIVYIKPPSQKTRRNRDDDVDIRGFYFLAGFAPGTRPLVAPEGWARKIPAGSKFVFEMHYTPVGSPQTDRSSIGLIFMDKKDVTHRMSTTMAIQTKLAIPPNEANYPVDAWRTFHRDTVLLSLFPHMHMRGKSFRYEVTYPDSKREVLLDVPRYDFNWQNSYILSKPKLIPRGSKLHCTAYFDNSENNLANPDPGKTVRWGQQTWDEMMIGWYDIGIPIAEAPDQSK